VLSVIICDLDLVWPSVGPDETDAILIVDANAVLTSAITR